MNIGIAASAAGVISVAQGAAGSGGDFVLGLGVGFVYTIGLIVGRYRARRDAAWEGLA